MIKVEENNKKKATKSKKASPPIHKSSASGIELQRLKQMSMRKNLYMEKLVNNFTSLKLKDSSSTYGEKCSHTASSGDTSISKAQKHCILVGEEENQHSNISASVRAKDIRH